MKYSQFGFSLISLCLILPAVSGSKFPSFIKVCKRNSDVFNCLVENIDRCREHFAKGIPRLAIPPLAPFTVPSLKIDGNQLAIHLTDVRVHHLVDMKVVGGKIDLGKHLILNVTVPNVLTEFEYEADGKLLGLTLKGRGKGYINATGVSINSEIRSHLVPKNGQTLIEIDNINVEYKTKDGTFWVDNFFQGQDELNDATNRLINENYNTFQEELNPDISKSISALFESISKNLYAKFSFDELFPAE